MKIKIKGEINAETLQEVAERLHATFNADGEYITKGATLYVNFYNKTDGREVSFVKDDEEVDTLTFDLTGSGKVIKAL